MLTDSEQDRINMYTNSIFSHTMQILTHTDTHTHVTSNTRVQPGFT